MVKINICNLLSKNSKTIKVVLFFCVVIMYYFFLLNHVIESLNKIRMNQLNIAILIFILASICGVVLSSLFKKNYDIIALLLYKLFSFFICLYIIVLDDIIYQNKYFDYVFLRDAINMMAASYFRIGTGNIDVLFLLAIFMVYVVISIIPFILIRASKTIMVKNIL